METFQALEQVPVETTDELIAESDRKKDLENCVLIVLNTNQSSIQFLSACAQSASVYVLFHGKQSYVHLALNDFKEIFCT